MTKMYGEMTGDEVMSLFNKMRKDLEANHDHRKEMVMIPKSTFVAIVSEYKDCLNRKFFFELGRSLQLEENQDSIRKSVPAKYIADFQDGVKQRAAVQQLMAAQCANCTKRFVSVRGVRGRVFIGAEKAKQSESSS